MMAFFEQLGKKLTDAGQGVAQQTKNFTETTRLNTLISDKERLLTQQYCELGKAYYARYKNSPDSLSPQTMEMICTLQQEISQYREEIKQIKGITKCVHCGADIPLNAAFCQICGQKVIQPTVSAEATRICPQCNAPTSENNQFCTVCGARFKEEL